MGRIAGYCIGSLMGLIPAIAIGVAIFGDLSLPEGMARQDLTEAQVDQYGAIWKWATILRIVSLPCLLVGAGIIWLLNWHTGINRIIPWICLVLGSLALSFHSAGFSLGFEIGVTMLVGVVMLIAALAGNNFAFWK
ncbi:MAG: hypothetical protein HKN23_21265 [Verrucomicrobiales bacterium]|nr:hypothetical protein [Verrucomicrobiales bacterium]